MLYPANSIFDNNKVIEMGLTITVRRTLQIFKASLPLHITYRNATIKLFLREKIKGQP